MIATTIEQSRRLLELGLNPKTADMCWVKDYTEQWVLIADAKSNIQHRLEGMYEYSGFQWQEHIALVPAWSLSTLLEVIPKEELIDLSVSKDNYWFCSGVHFDTSIYSNPIDAAYAQVKWLLEQGLIKKGEQDGQ